MIRATDRTLLGTVKPVCCLVYFFRRGTEGEPIYSAEINSTVFAAREGMVSRRGREEWEGRGGKGYVKSGREVESKGGEGCGRRGREERV